MANGLFGGGDGNPATPFLVEDGADLNAVRSALGKAYKQVANVDLIGYANWIPIGALAVKFSGVYDGGGFSVSNLNTNRTTNYTGLFGYSTGVLKGINILSGFVTSTLHTIGAVCGHNLGTVSFCSNQGCAVSKTGSSTANVGGVVGVTSATITNCYNTASVDGYGANVAGIVGSGTATDCYNTGSVTSATAICSGICSDLAIRCYNTGNITAPANTACGISMLADCTDCYNSGIITSMTQIAYGITQGGATRCYNSGNIRGYVGGYGICASIAIRCYALNAKISRVAPSTNTTSWFQITQSTSASTVGNYALDTMVLEYE